jgi:hypothetical protein
MNLEISQMTSSDVKTLGVANSSPSHQQQLQTGGGGGGKLLAQDKFSCQNRFVVLCIEATSQVVASGWSGWSSILNRKLSEYKDSLSKK